MRYREELENVDSQEGTNVIAATSHTVSTEEQEIPARDILRRIWIQQFHASEQGTPWRADQELPPSAQLIQSPYDAEAHYSKKKQTGWVGYKMHSNCGKST
jgi:hypothetical protein